MQLLQSGTPVLTLLVAVPMIAALLLWLVRPLRAYARDFGIGIALLITAGTIYVASVFDYGQAGALQLAETYPWIAPLGINWALGVNGLGLAMIILSAALTLLVLVSEGDSDQPGFVAWVLALEAFIMLIFTARDIFLFYVAFEAMLIPVYFLVGRYGHGEARRAALKFLLYSLAGGLIMLFGVITLWVIQVPTGPTFLVEVLAGAIPAGAQKWIFITFFIAFAIKAPMVPVHTWLPDTAAAATPGTSTLLVGILDKIGTFGMISFCLTLTPDAAAEFAPYIIILAVISVLYGALAALAQKDLMRLISFTSVSHFGFIVLGIFVGSEVALVGAMVYMVAHGLSIAGMFLIGGYLTRRGGTQEISGYGGMQRTTPLLAGTFLVAGLAAIALPGLSGFPAEYMVLVGSFKEAPVATGFAVLGAVLAALYLLLPYQRIFTGREEKKFIGTPDLNRREIAVITPLILAMVVIGFWPAPVVGTVEGVANVVITQTPSGNATPAAGQKGN